MNTIATYVFIDLETTGLPNLEYNKTRITELSMVAVKRRHILERPGVAPRVQDKLIMCFNPRRMIDPNATRTTGLCNDLLEHETDFNMNVFNTINEFLQCLEAPVCLIAHNGHSFDFPILKNHFDNLGVSLSPDIVCADSLYAFHDIFEAANGVDVLPVAEVRRRIYWGNNSRPGVSYSVLEVYQRVLGRPALEGHRAENDCIMVMEIAISIFDQFMEWVARNQRAFNTVIAMRPGAALGY